MTVTDLRAGPRVSGAATGRTLLPALVLGFGVHGLTVTRSLGRRGVHVEAADPDILQPHRNSRYLKALHRVPSLDDERLVEFLLAYARARGGPTALFLTTDRMVPVVSAHRAELAPYFVFNLPPHVVITELMEKSLLPGFLERSGCRYPRTLPLRSLEALDAVEREIGFPCIIKPALRSYGFKAAVARSRGELETCYAIAARHTNELVAQHWIPGGDNEVYFCFAYLARDGHPAGTFVGHKLHQYPRGTGIAASAEGCDDEFVREETLRLFQLAGYRGFGSGEFRRDPESNRYYLIEFTVGRTDYNVGCAVINGVDLPYLGYRDLANLPAESAPRQRNRRRWVEWDREVKSILQPGPGGPGGPWRTALALAATLSPGTGYACFDPADPGPFLARSVEALWSVARAILRKARRVTGRA